jgi:TPP-dependent 2-oxoacid decarboxylase
VFILQVDTGEIIMAQQSYAGIFPATTKLPAVGEIVEYADMFLVVCSILMTFFSFFYNVKKIKNVRKCSRFSAAVLRLGRAVHSVLHQYSCAKL